MTIYEYIELKNHYSNEHMDLKMKILFTTLILMTSLPSIASSIDDTIEMRKEMLSMHARHYCAVSLTDMELSSNLLKAVYNCEQGRRVDLEIESGEPCAISCMSGLVGLREKIKVNKAKDRI